VFFLRSLESDSAFSKKGQKIQLGGALRKKINSKKSIAVTKTPKGKTSTKGLGKNAAEDQRSFQEKEEERSGSV